MAVDALDPGPDGDYPHLDMALQPTGLATVRGRDGKPVLIDLEATAPDGRRVTEIKPKPTTQQGDHS